MLDIDSRLELALAVRRRLVAELVASQAVETPDAATHAAVARLQLKIKHLDAMIANFEAAIEKTAWWPFTEEPKRTASEFVARFA